MPFPSFVSRVVFPRSVSPERTLLDIVTRSIRCMRESRPKFQREGKKKTGRQRGETVSAAQRAPRSKKRYTMQLYPDGSLRPVATSTRGEGEHRQALADLYGDLPLPSTGGGVRNIRSILSEVDLGITGESLAPELLSQAWSSAVGEFVSTQAHLISLSNGTAVVHTSHPAVRFELQRQNRRLIAALNSFLGEGCVQKVRFR